jgi:hypothetical protein
MSDEYKKCIESCYLCAAACDNCAASCLEEENLEMMRECIKLDMQYLPSRSSIHDTK